ncbi:hypothetical protein IFM89_002746 [Coptis chinensis]|uniref:Uncharacterized protein n=1 Tax=Coptis chinensis TaxID=261450 RepID=A0A835M427_9MAGN|nr:hypothetical protein IFM89_002746 [Coptis chinensis]
MNSFSGVVLDFPSLTGLTFLNMNNTGFFGVFPWKSLENITGLQFLIVRDNLFKNSSFPVEILKLERLYWLYLTNCSLEGRIPPEIGNLMEFTNLELSDNTLSGPIPPEINKLNKLLQLELYDNYLTGDFPVGFGNLSSLIKFDASNNNLKGDLSELKSFTQLVSL